MCLEFISNFKTLASRHSFKIGYKCYKPCNCLSMNNYLNNESSSTIDNTVSRKNYVRKFSLDFDDRKPPFPSSITSYYSNGHCIKLNSARIVRLWQIKVDVAQLIDNDMIEGWCFVLNGNFELPDDARLEFYGLFDFSYSILLMFTLFENIL